MLPLELGHAWCLDQAGRTNDAIAAYRKTLDIAWHKEVVGDFNLRAWVTDIWSDVRAGENPFHSRDRGGLGPGICFSEETIGYLLNLLDAKHDASEIKQLKAKQSKLAKMGRAVTPILIPLQPGVAFAELIDTKLKVTFDLDGSGRKRQWGWITPKAAWLVYDPEHRGEIKSALQMFGTVTFWMFWRDGYDALSSLDGDGDGSLKGDELAGLALWNDSNEDGISQPGEVWSVRDYGIVAIRCAASQWADDMSWNEAGVSYSKGTAGPSYDWVSTSER